MKTTAQIKPSELTDEHTLESAASRFGHPIPIYDDGFGRLFIHRDSTGISGIVRAMSWSDAYGICEDEFFPAADDDATDGVDIEAMTEHEQACWDEAYGYRNSGRREADGSISCIYAKDLNGDSLDLLTNALALELGITLTATLETEDTP
jgi:hypothetical protein